MINATVIFIFSLDKLNFAECAERFQIFTERFRPVGENQSLRFGREKIRIGCAFGEFLKFFNCFLSVLTNIPFKVRTAYSQLYVWKHFSVF